MNMNQQTEIEDLFRRINKSMAKDSNAKITDEDLNKVRAFVIQSKRPLQSVRLLQKEREERMIDQQFTLQKEKIISQAKELDREAKSFKDLQNRTVAEVQSDIEIAKKNQLHRKKKGDELDREEKKNQELEMNIK